MATAVTPKSPRFQEIRNEQSLPIPRPIGPQSPKSRPMPYVIIAYDKLKFDKHDVIGRGAFATVYNAHHLDWGC